MDRRTPGLCVLAAGLVACGAGPPLTASDYSKEAEALLSSALEDPSHARVISISTNTVLERACGWVDLGPPKGVALFEVDGRLGHAEANVTVSGSAGGSVSDRVEGVYDTELSRLSCARAHVLPPTPVGFALPQAAATEVDRLCGDNPIRWAIFQPPDEVQWMGIRRRVGGGFIMTPMFLSRAETQSWIRAEGDALADEEQAKGKAAMARNGACLAQAHGEAEMNKCSDAGLDMIIQLHASGTQK